MSKLWSVSVLRGVGHPWNPDDFYWDMMLVKAVDDDVLARFEIAAEEKGWRLFSTGYERRMHEETDSAGHPVAVFYRPQKPGGYSLDKIEWDEQEPSRWPDKDNW